MLSQTLDDQKLSRGERSALDRILDHLEPDSHQRALYRSVAFDLARENLNDPQSVKMLEWLEEVMRMLEATGQAGGKPALAESYFAPSDDCPARIGRLLAKARHRVEICVFTITDNRISDAILDAHHRGISVRIISDDDKSEDRGSDIQRLIDAGVPVRNDRSRDHMHHKFALFDHEILLNGSYNWTRSAAERNEENFLLTGEPRFIEPYSKLFERLWDEFE